MCKGVTPAESAALTSALSVSMMNCTSEHRSLSLTPCWLSICPTRRFSNRARVASPPAATASPSLSQRSPSVITASTVNSKPPKPRSIGPIAAVNNARSAGTRSSMAGSLASFVRVTFATSALASTFPGVWLARTKYHVSEANLHCLNPTLAHAWHTLRIFASSSASSSGVLEDAALPLTGISPSSRNVPGTIAAKVQSLSVWCCVSVGQHSSASTNLGPTPLPRCSGLSFTDSM
mmetsp:Transcript_24432/g.60809  ORF Transcript_24432/g.60809 Transcript_24432/m.60809 type:complete len:235 (+) Transcript_24432:1063-1767(+)